MTPDFFTLAQAHRSAGRFEEAVRCCREILQTDPHNVAAAHLCGCASLDAGNIAAAVGILERTAQAQPESAQAQFDFAQALQAAGRFPDATVSYRRAVSLKPDLAPAWHGLGVVLRRIQNWSDAAGAFRRACELAPGSIEHFLALGFVLLEQKDWPQAESVFLHSQDLDRSNGDAAYGLGLALKGALRFAEAADAFKKALVARPHYLEALFNLGSVSVSLERWDDAIDALQEAASLAQASPEILENLGNVLWSQRRFNEAVSAHSEAVRLRPDHASNHINLGNALLSLLRFEEATASFKKALALSPKNASALCSLGNAALAQNRLDEALGHYREALAVHPEHPHAAFNQSLALLLKGELNAGWPGYELRWALKQKVVAEPPLPKWTGEQALAGKSILVFSEQGLGDTIQFVRYLPLLQAQGATVTLRVQPALHPLLSCLEGVRLVSTDSDTLPHFDTYCLLLSLPFAFRTDLATIPSPGSYLRASTEKIGQWRSRLVDIGSPKIGIVCSGNAAHRNDHNRSIPLELFSPLAVQLGTRLLLLQKEIREEDRNTLTASNHFVFPADGLEDFSDTAAIIAQLDLVITIDSAIAHLAGALGKPVWTLLPFAPDWRWMLDRYDSPWYSSMRLFRQKRPGDWTAPLESVQQELAKSFFPAKL
jgi:tetratricopeptide (TPR) repeat protein/ADP-heptose:LPS heptosyltransferase